MLTPRDAFTLLNQKHVRTMLDPTEIKSYRWYFNEKGVLCGEFVDCTPQMYKEFFNSSWRISLWKGGRMKMKVWLVLLVGTFLVGCTTYYPPTISTTSLYSDREVPIKVVTGKSYSTALFGFIEIEGNNSVAEAIKRAKAKEDGDTLVNVFVDRTAIQIPFNWFPLITLNTTTVTGTLIRYEGFPRKSKETPKPKEQTTPVKSILE